MNAEQKYCAAVVQHLTEQGWEVYQEVETGAGRTDVVAVRAGIRWAIEVKTSMNLTVMDQARANAAYFHYSSLAVPAPAGGRWPRSWQFATECGNVFGYGVISLRYSERHDMTTLRIESRGRLNRRPLPVALWEQQKTEVAAGTNSGGQWTDFKWTVRQLEQKAQFTPGIKLKEAVQGIDHHYTSEPSAVGCVSRYIRGGIITTLRLDNGKLYLVDA
jgi:hypothetical protein